MAGFRDNFFKSKPKNSKPAGLSSQHWLGLAGLILFGGVLYYAGPEAWQQILRADARYLLLAFGVNVLLMGSSSLRWGLLTNAVAGEKVCSYFNYFYYLVLGRVFGLFVSFNLGDYGVRPLALRATNSLSTARMVYALILDKLFDLLLAVGLSGVVLFLLLDRLSWQSYWSLVGLIAMLLLLFWSRYEQLVQFFLRFFSPYGSWLLRRSNKAAQWFDFLAANRNLVGAKAVTGAYGMTVLRFALLVLYHYLIAAALHLPFSYLDFWLVVPIIQLGLIAAFTPAALGVLELSWLGVLTWLGYQPFEVSVFVVGQRIFSLLFTLLVGLFISPWMFSSKRSEVGHKPN